MSLRADALRIWQAGVAAVHPSRLVHEHLHLDGHRLFVQDETVDLCCVGRILIVGAGKAAAPMAAAVETLLGPEVATAHDLAGWINIPQGGAANAAPLRSHLQEVRPSGLSEPTPAAEAGTRRILLYQA